MREKSSAALVLAVVAIIALAAWLPASPAPVKGSGEANVAQPASPGGGRHFNVEPLVATTTETVTTTITTTTTVTFVPPGQVNILVNVKNQYGLWINGAVVQVFLVGSAGPPPVHTLEANGTTTNGEFVAQNVTGSATFTVQVYTPSGRSANQTVQVGTNDAVVNFVIPTAPPPTLSLQNVTVSTSTQSPGQPFSITADIVNTSNSTAYGTVLSVSPPPQFSLLNTGSTIHVGDISAGAVQPLTLLMSVSKLAATPGYAVGYSLNFSDYLGLSYGVSGSISLPIPPTPTLVIQNVALTPTIIQPGAAFSLTAAVVNTSNSTAFNAFITVVPPVDVSLLNTGSVIALGTLYPGGTEPLVLRLLASTSAASTASTMAYSLSYTDYFLNKENTTGNLFVPVSGNPISPKLIVSSATFSSPNIHPGQNFTVPIVITNVANFPAGEVVLYVNATTPLVNTGSAGDYTLGVISANGTLGLKLGFSSPPSAPLGAYPIRLNLAYVDAFGSLYTSSQVLVATIVGQPTLVFNSVQFKNNPLTPGLQTFFNAQILNTGGETALNVKISFLGAPSFFSNTTIFLGSIQSGKTGNATSYLQIPTNTSVGTYRFDAEISYTDSSGAGYEVQAPYTVTVAPFSGPSLSITNTLMSPEVLSPGTQGVLTIYYKNDGSSPANNIVLNLANGSKIFTSNYFGLGALGAGQSGTTTVGVNVDPKISGGNYMVNIVANYTDSTNATHTFTFPLEVTIYGTTSFFTVKNEAIIVGLVVLLVASYVGITYLRRRRPGK